MYYENRHVDIPQLALAILVCEAVGATFAVFSKAGITAVPPGSRWLFGAWWIVLYAFIGAAGYRVWSYGERMSLALWLLTAVLILDALWSPLFFALRLTHLAMVDAIVLVALTLAVTILFYRRSRIAGALMVPYLCWIIAIAFMA